MIDWKQAESLFTPLELQSALVLGVSGNSVTRLTQDGISLIDQLPWPRDLRSNDRQRFGREWFVKDNQQYINWANGRLYEGQWLVQEIEQGTDVGRSAVEYAIAYAEGAHRRVRIASEPGKSPATSENFLNAALARNTTAATAGARSIPNSSPTVLFIASLEPGSELVAGTHLTLIRSDNRITSTPSVKCLLFDEAVEANVVSTLLSSSGASVRLVKGSAHGSRDTLFGHESQPALSRLGSSTWAGAFSGKIVHLCACETASNVGGVSLCDTFVSQGATAAFGYEETILAPYRPQSEASSFDHFVDLTLLNGGTCQDALDRFQREIKNHLETHGNDVDDYMQQLNSLLVTMSTSLVVKGNPLAKL